MDARALQGVRVVDLSQVWAGPLCAQYLADFGAEVIRVESAVRSREMMWWHARPERDYADRTRNRLGVSMNIRTVESVRLVKQLISISDVLVENFTPGTMEKLGLSYETVRQVNPTLVMISLSAAGQSGPWRDARTLGPTLNALYGVKSLLGYPGDSWPREDASEVDPIAGTFGLLAVMAALLYRECTGKGQHIDLAQGESMLSLAADPVLEYTMHSRVTAPRGNRPPLMVPYGMYPCRGDDKWIALAVRSDQEWQRLVDLMGRPGWACDDALGDLVGRQANVQQIDAHIAEWTSQFDAYELTLRLQREGIPAYPVLDSPSQLNDPHLRERRLKMVVEAPVNAADIPYGIPWKLSETPGAIYLPEPRVGEHNDYICGQLLGLKPSECEELTRRGVLA